jgi:hypothetical protein
MSARRQLLPVIALLACAAGPPQADPDWPCMQRLVPTLTAGTFWAGQAAAGDWRAEAKVAALVGKIAPRNLPQDAAEEQLKAFAASIPLQDRPVVFALTFAGLVDEVNAQRNQVIDRLRDVDRRQRALTVTAAHVTAELHALPSDAPDAQREEITTRRAFLIRDYQEVERTIRYACEVPVQLEARLGVFAQVLQTAMTPP